MALRAVHRRTSRTFAARRATLPPGATLPQFRPHSNSRSPAFDLTSLSYAPRHVPAPSALMFPPLIERAPHGALELGKASRIPALIAAGLLAVLAFAHGRRERRWQFALSAVLFAVMFVAVSCGGVGSAGTSGGSGGGGGPTNPGTPTGAVQPLSVSITINGTTQTVPGLSLTVQ